LTPLLEKPPEVAETDPMPKPAMVESIGADIDETALGSDGVLTLSVAPSSASKEADASPGEEKEPLRIALASSKTPGVGGRLRASFEALGEIRSSRSTGDWLQVASVLKGDALRFRSSSRARHAAVLLAIADALTFTNPEDPALDSASYVSLERSLSLLSEPFIPEQDEENFLVDLLSNGWNLAPSIDVSDAPA
jgi:hypothetical protein